MSEFSKQYREAFDFDFDDFDYKEIFEGLEPNHYKSQICEGLGTVAVAKSGEGKMLLAVEVESMPDMVEWVSLETAIERAKSHN